MPVYAVYGCVICEINAVSNIIQWFLSVSNTNPHGIFYMPFSKPIANWVQLSVWSYPQCTWGNYQIVIVTLLVPNAGLEINIVRGIRADEPCLIEQLFTSSLPMFNHSLLGAASPHNTHVLGFLAVCSTMKISPAGLKFEVVKFCILNEHLNE